MTGNNGNTTSKIKPIETQYKGYRFRSRLEARWAIFFDALGLEWNYEVEGFDLGNDIRYLPDFLLKRQNLWVEVKPNKPILRKKLYACGKIRKGDWRSTIVNIEGAIEDPSDEWTEVEIEGYNLDYTGPYFVGCDHGCTHGTNTHGVGLSCCTGWKTDYNPHDGSYEYGQEISTKCLRSIEESDFVFAWIDDLTCYGTLIELGVAIALQKDVRVAVSNNLKPDLHIDDYESGVSPGTHDLWFLESLSHRTIFSDSAKTAFNELYSHFYDMELFKISTVAEQTNCRYSIVYGDPLEQTYRGVHLTAATLGVDSSSYMDAMNKARSARFEHGETP